MASEIKRLVAEAERLGCRVEQTRKCHIRIVTPTSGFVVLPSTPSENRGLKNAVSVLRRYGVPMFRGDS